MSRRFVLVSYDMAEDRRRNRVAKTLRDYGDRIQYSVFCCQVNPRELHRLKQLLQDVVKGDCDRIFFVDAGKVDGQKPMPEVSYIGQPWAPEERAQII